MCLLTTSPLY